MENKVNAIVVRCVDYKDNDKMLTLYSLEKGLIGAGIKGVKKATAKLAFAAQPFCFAEYVLSVNGDRNTVVGATEIESFYKLRLNLHTYYCASTICEFVLKCAQENFADEKLFVLTVNAIKQLNFGEKNAKRILCEFLFKALELLGYGIDCRGCAVCGKSCKEGELSFFDFEKGLLICEKCEYSGVTRLLTQTAVGLESLQNGAQLNDESYNYLLKFFNYYLEQKTGETLKCLPQLLSLQ